METGRLSRTRSGWRIDFESGGASPSSLAAAKASVAADGGGELQWWQSAPTVLTDALAEDAGLPERRDLLQVRRPLPVTDPEAPLPVRAFVPGQDEDAFLEVNNRAFDWHPEQGGWDRATLLGREAEEWFDAPGFLLHEEGDRLAGFCWTKVHPGRVGEIYVIAVDPAFAGRGLGRALTLAGLRYLGDRGCTTGMLYVDGSNTTARAMYDRLGFVLDHIDRCYRGMVQAPETPTSAPMP